MLRCNVSVVIPYFRASKTIERALVSIASQSLLPEEVLLVDDNGDASDDDFLVSLKDKFSEIGLKIFKNKENQGAAYSRNIGWNNAKAKYIAFLDSDDSWEKDKLQIQYSIMEKTSSILSGHSYHLMNEIESGDESSFSTITFSSLLIKNKLITPSVMLLRNLEERFDPAKRYVDDHLLWLLISRKKRGKVIFINRSMAIIYKNMYGEAGLSSHLWNMEKGEIDTYYKVYKASGIGFFLTLLLCAYSLIKFVKRIIVSMLRKINHLHFQK